jgi:Undecaprenyl-phosphate glucose phosphotransferase
MLQLNISEPAVSAQKAAARSRNDRQVLAALVASTEMVIVATSTYLAFIAYHQIVWGGLPDTISYGWLCAQLALMYGMICLADKQYDFLGGEWNRQALYRGALALALAFVFLLAFMFITGTVSSYSRGTFLAQFAFALPAQILTRAMLLHEIELYRKHGHPISPGVVALVFPGVQEPTQLLEQLSSGQEDIRKVYRLESTIINLQLQTILRDVRTRQCDSVLLLFHSDRMDAVARAVNMLSEMPIRIQLLPVGMRDLMRCSRIGCFGQARVFEIASGPAWVMDRLLKRSSDLFIAAAAGLMLMPLMLIVAALIKLDSEGPILFIQNRHGYNNKRIRVLKFRTMVANHEGRTCQATRNDSRVTRLGRILRRTNIDELPQLFNVIRGDMSIVGPRPHAVWHNQMFAGQIARLSRRHNVKPGITGWAQVNGLRGETDTFEKMRDRVEHDIYYIDNWSFAFDLKIILMTIFSTKSYNNAY